MTWEIAFVIALLIAGFVSFLLEKVPTDATAIFLFASLLVMSQMPFVTSLPTAQDLLSVFANPAPIAIASLFIMSAALEKAGLIDQLALRLERLTTLGPNTFLVVMILAIATASAFVNNTPVVVVMLPVVLSLAKKMDQPASRFLIPLSYASIFGGICTLLGTSTNILASDVMRKSGLESLGMFELAALGIPLLCIGTAYLFCFGTKLLPRRETLMSILSDEERKEFITEAYVIPGSKLEGESLEGIGLLRKSNVRVLEIIRNGIAIEANLQEVKLTGGDRLLLACRPSGVAQARNLKGLGLTAEEGVGLETIAAHEGAIVEGVIGPRSSIVGQTVRSINFRQRYRMIVLAIHRRSYNVRDQLHDLPLQFGDTLLMMGTDDAIQALRRGNDLMLLDQPRVTTGKRRSAQPVTLGCMAGIVGATTFLGVPVAVAAIVAVAIVFATRTLAPREGYDAVDWRIIFLIYGMLGLGMAMETSGAAQLIASTISGVVSASVPPSILPIAMLAALYLCTSVLTELLSNNATIVVMAPIAFGIATSLGLDPRPFIIAAAIASSASFASPIGYQTNTYVYGVGGYRFTDFIRVGLPLNLLFMTASIILIPMIWPLD